MRTIPNMLSIFRICLVPVLIVAYFSQTDNVKTAAALVFSVAAFSDFLDGYLARKYEASTSLGKVLDPMGDKMMTIAVMLCITIDGLIPVWAIIAAFTKELLMAIGGLVVHRRARCEIPPCNVLGKASTVMFFLVCVTLMLFRNIPYNVAIIAISAALLLMLAALVSYVVTFFGVMDKNKQ